MPDVKSRFSKAAKNYDEASEIQQLAAQDFLKNLTPLIKKNQKILDLGCGTSFLAKNLATKKNLKIFEIDLALEMLQNWSQRPENVFAIQGDFEKLPLKENQFDLIISSFSLQWIKNFEAAFLNFSKLLENGGTLAFCLPVQGSLQELKKAEIFSFNDLPESRKIKNLLEKNGFKEKFFSAKTFKQEFQNGLAALKSIKKTGANISYGKQNFVTKKQLAEFNSFCLKNCDAKTKNFVLSWLVACFIFTK
jgi:malonyl-CoA O-methyltransferase